MKSLGLSSIFFTVLMSTVVVAQRKYSFDSAVGAVEGAMNFLIKILTVEVRLPAYAGGKIPFVAIITTFGILYAIIYASLHKQKLFKDHKKGANLIAILLSTAAALLTPVSSLISDVITIGFGILGGGLTIVAIVFFIVLIFIAFGNIGSFWDTSVAGWEKSAGKRARGEGKKYEDYEQREKKKSKWLKSKADLDAAVKRFGGGWFDSGGEQGQALKKLRNLPMPTVSDYESIRNFLNELRGIISKLVMGGGSGDHAKAYVEALAKKVAALVPYLKAQEEVMVEARDLLDQLKTLTDRTWYFARDTLPTIEADLNAAIIADTGTSTLAPAAARIQELRDLVKAMRGDESNRIDTAEKRIDQVRKKTDKLIEATQELRTKIFNNKLDEALSQIDEVMRKLERLELAEQQMANSIGAIGTQLDAELAAGNRLYQEILDLIRAAGPGGGPGTPSGAPGGGYASTGGPGVGSGGATGSPSGGAGSGASTSGIPPP